jgi:hypothetical protein
MAQDAEGIVLRISEMVGPHNRVTSPSNAIDLDELAKIVTTGSPNDVTVMFRSAGLSVFVRSGNIVYVRLLRDEGENLTYVDG